MKKYKITNVVLFVVAMLCGCNSDQLHKNTESANSRSFSGAKSYQLSDGKLEDISKAEASNYKSKTAKAHSSNLSLHSPMEASSYKSNHSK